ncbi:hypothetical protein FEE96_10795 [Parasedimentitalea maritima]|uniref:Hedgehog/Intein (Hint) domain-containing protein n=1 Tax=Parasedimentitalea maritima TaxID=2578117 RepID=A0ABY2UZT1_9RHOB|nr:Hint domain-containing protein [Zongyanglinia marina]TLP64266.1 hypothetical protein FEE96_10795 [Zongyanglinia marina]
MLSLDNDIWLTGSNGTAESASMVLEDGGNSTTVTGTFSADSWDASQSGNNVSDFGSFGASDPVTASFGFSNPVTNLSFQLEHVNSIGSSFDDKLTLWAYDADGVIIPSETVIASLGGVTDQIVSVNPDGSISIEAEGADPANITVLLPGPISQLAVALSNGEDAPISGGVGLSDLSFSIPAALGHVVEGTDGSDLIDTSYLGDPEGDRVDNNDALDGSNDDEIVAGDGDDTILAGDGNDSVNGGLGNDSILGGDGNDTLYGGDGHDYHSGGDGDDLISGGSGNDTLTGGWGDDTLLGGDGDDRLEGLYGNDLIYAGAGDDHVFGRDQDDLIYGEEGNDTLIGSMGVDTVYGGDGHDTLAGSQGNDEIHGGDGNDLVFIGVYEDSDRIFLDAGNDFLDGASAGSSFYGEGGTGNDYMNSGVGDDTLYGDEGRDTLNGGSGNDYLDGGSGSDSINGGSGNDTLIGGDDGDTLSGGDDRDLIIAGDGDVVDGGEGGDDYDQLDISALGGPSRTNIIYDSDNNESGTVEILDELGNVTGSLTFSNIEEVIACFTPGSLILTAHGEVPVEHLSVGDKVLTRDNGYQTIRWVGRRNLNEHDLASKPQFAPVQIRANALGNGMPERDMYVSPQHRMLITGALSELLFGDPEVLVPALHLINDYNILRATSNDVTYIHLLFDQHEIIQADRTWSESFQPGDQTLVGMDVKQRKELVDLFPELQCQDYHYPTARRALKSHEAFVLQANIAHP